VYSFRPEIVVILGPSHCKYLRNQCSISSFDGVQTPIGDIEIDIKVRDKLVGACGDIFKISSQEDDITEHSLEMQYPFISKVFCKSKAKILPIQVGQFSDILNRKNAAEFILKSVPNLDSEKVLFIISSDFCHYGAKFDYKPFFRNSKLSSNQNISIMDCNGFNHLNDPNPITAFTEYLKSTGNTICGREPILLFLQILDQLNLSGKWELVDYAQSNFLTSPNDHSVSYLSAIYKITT
jgi:MEMO1 family protein